MSNSWHELMQSLQFTGNDSAGNPSEEVISAFEQEHHIVFPPDYREFCQLFGTGLANDWFRFYCPGNPEFLMAQEILQLTIDHIRRAPSGNDEVDDRKIDLLSNGLWIGEDRGAYFLMCDLRTYSEKDSSYDLYWVLWDCPESEDFESDIKFVGRSFFEFVRDFCYGSRVNELYQEFDRAIPQTYERF
jgi:hypothetical protein